MMKTMPLIGLCLAAYVGGAVSIASATNPTSISTTVNARISLPGVSGSVYVDCPAPSGTCNYYNAADTAGAWNGKYTSANHRLSNAESGSLSFPLPATTISYNGQSYVVSISAADVDRYYEYHLYKSSDGYTKMSGASLAMNCHGYSTGLGYWMDSFGTLMADDYTSHSLASDLRSGVIRGTSSHSIKIEQVTTSVVNGEQRYTLVKTREKNHASGVYEKTYNQTFNAADNVGFTFYKKK